MLFAGAVNARPKAQRSDPTIATLPTQKLRMKLFRENVIKINYLSSYGMRIPSAKDQQIIPKDSS